MRFKEVNEIIKWFKNTFSYELKITTPLRYPSDYKVWNKEDFDVLIDVDNEDNIITARFLFKTIEDKTLFDLTWR